MGTRGRRGGGGRGGGRGMIIYVCEDSDPGSSAHWYLKTTELAWCWTKEMMNPV